MSDPLQHVNPGDPVRAATINATIDGAKIAKSLASTGGGFLAGYGASNIRIRVLNATGEDLDRFAVVEISEPIFSPDDDETAFLQAPAFRGTAPSSETGSRFAVLQEPALKNTIVPGCVVGASVVRLDVQGESDEFAGPGSDPSKMMTGSEGEARIIWKEPGTGDKWGIVLFPVGGGSSPAEPALYGVVVATIHHPVHPTAGADDPDFFAAMGEIRIEGGGNKTYKCACRDLAGGADEFPEAIPCGTTVQVALAGQYPNPDFDPEQEPSEENPEKLDWYVAVKTTGSYSGILLSQLTLSDSSAIRIRECDGNILTFTVHGYYLHEDQYLPAGVGVATFRQPTEEGLRLVVVKSPSAITPEAAAT